VVRKIESKPLSEVKHKFKDVMGPPTRIKRTMQLRNCRRENIELLQHQSQVKLEHHLS
jgi:hypothetical protein